MTDQSIIIAVAKLDVYYVIHGDIADDYILKHDTLNASIRCLSPQDCWANCPHYLTSRDAIISVIEKQGIHHQLEMIEWLATQKLTGADQFSEVHNFALEILKATPKQLCIALLKATGKWEE